MLPCDNFNTQHVQIISRAYRLLDKIKYCISSNYSAPFTEGLKIVSNNSAKVVTLICSIWELNAGADGILNRLISKNSAKLKRDYYFHAEFLEARYTTVMNELLSSFYIISLKSHSSWRLWSSRYLI